MQINREQLLKADKEVLVDTFISLVENNEELQRRKELSLQIAKEAGRKKELFRKQAYFTQLEVTELRQLNLTDAEKSLLMILSPRLSLKTGLIVEGTTPLMQDDIQKLTGWESRSYLSKVIKKLVSKSIVIEVKNGRQVLYKLNPQYVSKGKRRRKDTEFAKLYNTKLKALALSTDAGAFLFTIAMYLEYQTNFVIIDGKRANQKVLLSLMGWKTEERIKKAIEELVSYGALYKVRSGRQYNYLVDARFCFFGGLVSDWLENPEVKRIVPF